MDRLITKLKNLWKEREELSSDKLQPILEFIIKTKPDKDMKNRKEILFDCTLFNSFDSHLRVSTLIDKSMENVEEGISELIFYLPVCYKSHWTIIVMRVNIKHKEFTFDHYNSIKKINNDKISFFCKKLMIYMNSCCGFKICYRDLCVIEQDNYWECGYIIIVILLITHKNEDELIHSDQLSELIHKKSIVKDLWKHLSTLINNTII